MYSPSEIEMVSAWFEGLRDRCEDRLREPGTMRAVAEDLGRLLGPLM
jgi:hypothetical protein